MRASTPRPEVAIERVKLVGGPFGGQTVVLTQMGGGTSTFVFRVRGQVGCYVNGVWRAVQ